MERAPQAETEKVGYEPSQHIPYNPARLKSLLSSLDRRLARQASSPFPARQSPKAIQSQTFSLDQQLAAAISLATPQTFQNVFSIAYC
tara:strand:- start:83516 stop:83779 length:264 start_codon:yes stop_codon:yes gene_type:complete